MLNSLCKCFQMFCKQWCVCSLLLNSALERWKLSLWFVSLLHFAECMCFNAKLRKLDLCVDSSRLRDDSPRQVHVCMCMFSCLFATCSWRMFLLLLVFQNICLLPPSLSVFSATWWNIITERMTKEFVSSAIDSSSLHISCSLCGFNKKKGITTNHHMLWKNWIKHN